MRALMVVLLTASATVALLSASAYQDGVARGAAPQHEFVSQVATADGAPDDRAYFTKPAHVAGPAAQIDVESTPQSPEPERSAAPRPAPVAAPDSTASSGCPTEWFCYPRLGIRGAIVPYTDCSGSTDVGTAIRRFTCVGGTYILAHAYTQFGKITSFAIGDKVMANGRTYTVYDSFTQQSCTAPARPPAVLSMQTSLSSAACGPILVVQAR